jgi:hypothetical protein
MVVVFKIVKDLITPKGESCYAVGYHFDISDNMKDKAARDADIKAFDEVSHIRFRLKDDDGEIYYYGLIPAASFELKDGGEELMRPVYWGEYFAGCTIIEHYVDGKWQEVVN